MECVLHKKDKFFQKIIWWIVNQFPCMKTEAIRTNTFNFYYRILHVNAGKMKWI